MHSFYILMALAAFQTTAHVVTLGNLTAGFSRPTLGYSAGKAAQCVSGKIAISISATTTKLLLQNPANQTVTTEIIQELFQINSKIAAEKNGGSTRTQGTFGIDATLCLPVSSGKEQSINTIQVLTHGTGFDKSYWDIAPGYSYVDAAATAGYATLAYNRLGVGSSDHPDAIQVVQCTTDVEILHGIIQLVRSGQLASKPFSNVIGVGHSYGSIVQLGNNGRYPKDTDAAVLSGFTTQLQYLAYAALANNPVIAAQHDPSRFGALSNGYLTNNAPVSFQLPFFRFPYFDQKIFDLQYAAQNTYTLGQQFTLPSIYAPAAAYQGPVDIVVGTNDFAFCLGDCSVPTDQAAAAIAAVYPAAGAGSQSYLVPQSGHAINAHYGAPLAFAQINKFLQSHSF